VPLAVEVDKKSTMERICYSRRGRFKGIFESEVEQNLGLVIKSAFQGKVEQRKI
jgi:hypothetical protein